MDSLYTTNKIIFDYFSFTIKNVEPEFIIDMLGMECCTFIDNPGSKGYHHRYYFDGISILFGGRDEVWCEMSGQGCRSFESFGSGDWFYLAYQVATNSKAQMTRIDIAYDDFNGLLDLNAILDDVHSYSWVSVARNVTEYIERTLSGVSGTTVMFGNRGANIACRIYDKAKERNRDDEIDHWVRCELQIRHKHADNFLYYLLADECKQIYGYDLDVTNRLDSLYFAVLNHFLRFIDMAANDDSNRWRKPLSTHWSRFIGSYRSGNLSLYSAPGVDYNLLKLRYVVENHMGGALYTYINIIGVDELLTVLEPKKFNLNKKYQALLDRQRLKEGALCGS